MDLTLVRDQDARAELSSTFKECPELRRQLERRVGEGNGVGVDTEHERQMSKPATDRQAPGTERAILAGGCFWGVEDLLRQAKGVVSTRAGYVGGELPDPTYRNHHGNAEAVEVLFDPAVLGYRALLELFFQIHDPTTYEQQGSDFGPSYRSAIFYTGQDQKDVALATIAEIEASGRWPGPVVTEINPEEPFWVAEPEHQKYLVRHPRGYSCHFARPNWRLDRSGG